MKKAVHGWDCVTDPRALAERIANRLNSIWLRTMYPFSEFGRRVSVHFSCDIGRVSSRSISLRDEVYLAPDVWLNVETESDNSDTKIVLGKGCRIGRRSTISAKNRIELEDDVLIAP